MEEELTSAAVMNYIRSSNINVFEFEKKRDIIISGDGRFMNSEDETTVVAMVFKLKDVLDSGDESEAVLFESLLKLQRMVMSVNVLKLTGVGISVNRLRNHVSKRIAEASRKLVKEWKGIVDEWLKDSNNNNNNNENNVQRPIKGESVQNPPQTEKPRSLIVRIKQKKDVHPKSPVTPDHEGDGVSKPVPDETLKKVEKISSSMETLKETGTGRSVIRVPVKKLGSQETWLKDGRRKMDSGLNTGRKKNQVRSGNLKKRLIDYAGDGVEEKLNTTVTNLKKSYLEDENMKKKRRIKLLSCEEQISLAVSRQELKSPRKRQIRRRW
ncbi:uncharacterized protein LOC143555511 [Bidens hawaiensis]|uniref:uncharacterized protein LOC143555511 n=1 Tax=Bidens hawaiensis TaxID=980011 RepID=UPI00404B60F8